MGYLEQRRDREVFRKIGPGAVEEEVCEVGGWTRVVSYGLHKTPTRPACVTKRRAGATE